MATAIWKDTIITLASGTAAFNIRLDNATGTIIYSGKADTINGQRKVRINDICADYIANNLPRWGETYGSHFTMLFCVEQGGVSKGTAFFYWNWSNDYEFDDSQEETVILLNAPIRNEIPVGMPLPYCVINDGGLIEIEGEEIEVETPNDFDAEVLNDHMVTAQMLTAPVRLATTPAGEGANTTDAEGETYVGVNKCIDYCLYYLNAYGAWDVLTIEGVTKPAADFSRVTSKRAYNNNYRQADGTIVSANEITRKVTFNTGWLTNLGASRMHHLLGTTKAFLVDTQTQDITPLVITDGSWERRAHRNDGMVNYTISAEVAQSFIRR